MKMKFRTYVIAALATTALVPLIAWSLLQWSDIRSSLAKDDWEQRFFTGIGSAFLVDHDLGQVRHGDDDAAHRDDDDENARHLSALYHTQLLLHIFTLALFQTYIVDIRDTWTNRKIDMEYTKVIGKVITDREVMDKDEFGYL